MRNHWKLGLFAATVLTVAALAVPAYALSNGTFYATTPEPVNTASKQDQTAFAAFDSFSVEVTLDDQNHTIVKVANPGAKAAHGTIYVKAADVKENFQVEAESEVLVDLGELYVSAGDEITVDTQDVDGNATEITVPVPVMGGEEVSDLDDPEAED